VLNKKENKNMQHKAKRRKKQNLMLLSMGALTLVCAGAIMLMGAVNTAPTGSRYTYTTESDIWFVEDGQMEIDAALPQEPVATAAVQEAPAAAPISIQLEVPPSAESELVKAEDFQPEQAEQAAEQENAETAVQAKPQEPVSILITATGDVTLGTYKTGSGRLSNFKSYVEKNGYEYFFANVRDLFSQDDLTIVNLEGPLTSHNTKRPRRAFNFRGYPEWVEILTSGSVEICNLANNHALDYKEEGFEDTYNTLTNAGIGASGYGPEYFTEVNGYTVGSLGFTEWNFEVDHILEKVAAAREKCDLLIVSMHWNEEHEYSLSRYCRKMGRALVDAGADLVIGNHSHVYGEIEVYKGKYIINSLGNFCFGGNDDPYVQKCAIFRQRFLMYPDGTVGDGGIDLIPAFISSNKEYNDFQPRIATPDEGLEILYAIAGLSPYMTADNVIWMEDSYVLKNNILNGGPQAATPTPEPTQEPTAAPVQQSQPDTETAEDMPVAQDMPIAQDTPR